MEISEDKFNILKDAYIFKQEIQILQSPLTKYEIKTLRKLIKQHITDGYTNYLRLVSVYNIDRDSLLNIYVRDLYNNLLEKGQS